MKKLLLLTVLLPNIAFANQMCEGWHKIATMVMEHRQNNVSIVKVMNIVPEDSPYHTKARNIITLAYEQPAYRTDDYKQKAISEFANSVYVVCTKTS